MYNLLWGNKLLKRLVGQIRRLDECGSNWGINLLPPVLRIRQALLGLLALTLAAGCAAPIDRTRQLLELDLAHRQGTIESLQEQLQNQPEPWLAYSLGVLYGADGQYENMNKWFQQCHKMSTELDQDIEYNRLGHWRDESEKADSAAAQGDWALAAAHLEKALAAVPEKQETRLRWLEARLMAFGPGLEEIRTLVTADRPEAVYRWLEMAAATDEDDVRLEVRVRLGSQLSGTNRENGDELAAYVVGELCRLDGDWTGMDKYYRQAGVSWRKETTTARSQVATGLLQQSLARWSKNQVPAALAKLDTANMVDPDRADVFQARRNMIALNRAQTGSQVAQILSTGDLDQRWLTFWMSRLYARGRMRDAGMVANELLRRPESLSSYEKSQALRVRLAFSRSIGNLDQTRDDLRALLASGDQLPAEAIILGDVLLAQSHYEEARHWFNKAQFWGDNSVSLILKKARIAFSQDQFQEMELLATLATEREPANADAQRMLAQARDLIFEAAGGAHP